MENKDTRYVPSHLAQFMLAQDRPVFGMLFIETLMIVFATSAAWDFLAAGWGDFAVLLTSDWSLVGLAHLSGFSMKTLQS